MIYYSLLDEAFPNEDKMDKINKKSKKNKDLSQDDKLLKQPECKSIQAPTYIIPQTCDNKQLYADVINTNINSFTYPNKDIYKNEGIKAFDFDEMDAYLNIKPEKSNNNDNSNSSQLLDILKNVRDNFKKPIENQVIEHFQNNNNTNIKVDINLYNLFLFIFICIIIILLIDQITKLITSA